VFGAGKKGLHWQTIAGRLAERMPEHHADITAEAISATMRAHVRSVDVKVAGSTLKGARRVDIGTAVQGRRSA
jgi:hypothetical protein